MSNGSTTVAAASQPEQKASETQQRQTDVVEDTLLRLATVDIPSEQRRLKQIKEPTSHQIMQEMSGTLLSIVKDVASGLVALRDWNVGYLNALSDHVEAIDSRVDTMENYGSETVILPEDAEVMAKATLGCKYLATQLLNGPHPIEERDEEGKQKLAELIAIAEQSERIIADSTLVNDEEMEDDETDDESENESESS